MVQQDDITALKVLTNVCQPLQGYNRNKGGGIYLSYSPYMLFADACVADPASEYPFNKLTTAYLAGDADSEKEIISYLISWKGNDAAFKLLLNGAPVLSTLEELSSNLSTLASAGIEALEYKKSNIKPSKDWIEQSKIIVSNARKQGGRAEIQIVNAVESIIASCE